MTTKILIASSRIPLKMGTSLVEALCESLQEDGFVSLLSSTTLDNILAQKFHNKLKFSNIGILDMHHGKEVFYIKKW